MDKMENTSSHAISINDRKNIILSGIKKIDSFDSEEFLLETIMGYMLIKGHELEIVKLDTYQGNVIIKGSIDSLAYIDTTTKKEKGEGLIARLFK